MTVDIKTASVSAQIGIKDIIFIGVEESGSGSGNGSAEKERKKEREKNFHKLILFDGVRKVSHREHSKDNGVNARDKDREEKPNDGRDRHPEWDKMKKNDD